MWYLKEEVNNELYFWHGDKHRVFKVDTTIYVLLYNLFIFLQYLQKSIGYEIDFLPADKHKHFLQIDSITLGLHGQACPKHSKQQLYNIFAISQGKRIGRSWFFPADNYQTFLQSDIRHPQITQNGEVDFWHADKHQNLLQIDTMILMEMVQPFQSS